MHLACVFRHTTLASLARDCIRRISSLAKARATRERREEFSRACVSLDTLAREPKALEFSREAPQALALEISSRASFARATRDASSRTRETRCARELERRDAREKRSKAHTRCGARKQAQRAREENSSLLSRVLSSLATPNLLLLFSRFAR